MTVISSSTHHECVSELELIDLRDPEDRPIDLTNKSAISDKMFDKTLADSYPASDPPSSIPNPHEDSFGQPCVSASISDVDKAA